MANPLSLARLALVAADAIREELERYIDSQLRGGIRVCGQYHDSEGILRVAEVNEDVLKSVILSLKAAVMKAVAQPDTPPSERRILRAVLDGFHLSAPDLEAKEAEILSLKARISLRNRQIRDLRRSLGK